MQKIKALLVDDESLARRLLREYLRAHPDVEIIGECDNGFDAVRALTEPDPDQQADLVFLDIQMPQLSGLEVLALSQRDHGVIFTTAFDEYALKAFELHALDYLLKPFSQARFDQALAQARKLLSLRQNAGLQRLLAQPQPAPLARILVRERQQVHVIGLAQVICVEAQDDYICIHTPDKRYLKTQSLGELEAGLDPSRFVRVHRSWLINLDHLLQLERKGREPQQALLRGGLQVPISRAGQERLKALLGA